MIKPALPRLGRRSCALAAFLLCAGQVLGPAAFGATRFGDISVTAQSPPPDAGAHGYLEYRITVTNHSADRSHDVALLFPKDSYAHGDCIRRITRSVKVGPASTARVSLLQPALLASGEGLAVSIDGKTQRETVYVSASAGRGGYARPGLGRGRRLLILVSRGAGHDFEAAALNSLKNAQWFERRFPDGIEFAQSESAPEDWSTNWLGYSCYDGVVLGGDELRDAPAPVRSALWQYVECGGTLLVLGTTQVPEAWRDRRTMGGGLASCTVGFGQCLVGGDTDYDLWKRAQWETCVVAWSATLSPFEETRSVDEANDEFPVVKALRTPVRGLLVLMLVFVLTIGPLNLWILSRKRRRIWLLWTVPAISLLTCGAVTLYAAIAEGWRGRIRTAALTILDQRAHRATTIGWTAFYCPVTPGGGLHFDYETELTPQTGESWYYGGGSGRARDMDWTHEQHLASGWLTARVPAHFMVRKSETRRERLAVRRAEDGSLRVVNGLGAEIRELWFADEAGRLYTARNVPAGAHVVLKPAGQPRSTGDAASLREAFRLDWLTSIGRLRDRPGEFLMATCYIAVLDAAPFVEQGLHRARSWDAESVVYGLVGEITDED